MSVDFKISQNKQGNFALLDYIPFFFLSTFPQVDLLVYTCMLMKMLSLELFRLFQDSINSVSVSSRSKNMLKQFI